MIFYAILKKKLYSVKIVVRMENTIYIILGGWKQVPIGKNRSSSEKKNHKNGQTINGFDISIMFSGAQNRFKSNPLYQI